MVKLHLLNQFSFPLAQTRDLSKHSVTSFRELEKLLYYNTGNGISHEEFENGYNKILNDTKVF